MQAPMQALEGVRILDFTQMMFGPWATQMLADMGADVIKVERTGGEWERSLAFMGGLFHGVSPFYLAMNRNKRSVALDLKSVAAQKALHRLVQSADVVVHNFRPGVMERLGLGYDALKEIKPDLIYCEASGYGSTGPYAQRPGQDLLIQSMTGIASHTGYAGQPPVPAGTSIADASGALHLAQAILVGLLAKARHGIGQKIEVNLLESAIAIQCQEAVAYLNMPSHWERSRSGVGSPWLSAPFGIYAVQDGHVAIAMTPMPVLAQVLELPELAAYGDDEAFAKRDAIYETVQARVASMTRTALVERLLAANVWSGPVYEFDEVFDDPQVRHSGIVQTVDHRDYGTLRLIGTPIHYAGTPATIRFGPAAVGEHNEEVLREAGLTDAEIQELGAR